MGTGLVRIAALVYGVYCSQGLIMIGSVNQLILEM